MDEARDRVREVGEAVCDGMRQMCDAACAIMPKDLAHAVGDVQKAVLSEIRSMADRGIGWIDERVAGGDRLREEWRQNCCRQT